mgnify:CR=1 FL=1
MHEYSLVEALVRRVEAEARQRGAIRIHGLKVTIGELAGVDPELFRTAYETFRAGTLCEGAPLDAPPEYRSTLTLESSPVAVPAVPCTTGVEPPAAAMRCVQAAREVGRGDFVPAWVEEVVLNALWGRMRPANGSAS